MSERCRRLCAWGWITLLFSSLEFLFVFLPVFFAVYFLVPDRYKNVWILLGSLTFLAYGTGSAVDVLLLIACTAVNWLAALGMGKYPARRRLVFLLGLVWDLGELFLFKYLNFLLGTVSGLAGLFGAETSVAAARLVLPVGISFYTFQVVAYLADVYRGKIPAERSFLKLAVWICMFPRLVEGPIVPYSAVSERMTQRHHSLRAVNAGLIQFTLGLGMKVLLANQIGKLWHDVGTIGFSSISTPLAWMAAVAYSMQIYFDFCGYTMMALGLGRMMGFSLPRNFRHPYMALTMTDFWRRWHITLGTWFREYVYIPLGGNRNGKGKTVRNLLAVWLLTGLWHGASWNFVLWGLLTCLLILTEKYWTGEFFGRVPAAGHLYMALVIPLMWMVFAIRDFTKLGVYFSRLFPFFGGGTDVFSGDWLKYGKTYGLLLLVGALFCTNYPRRLFRKIRGSVLCTVLLLAIFWVSVYCICIGRNDPFMYFRF